MKALIVVGLWALSGSYFGGLVERITGLGLTLPVLAAFLATGTYLGIRIALAKRSANGSRVLTAAGPNQRLTA